MKLIFTKPVITGTSSGDHWLLRDSMREMITGFLHAHKVVAVESKQVTALWNYQLKVWYVSVHGKISSRTGRVVDDHVCDAILLIANGNLARDAKMSEQLLFARLWDGTPVTRLVKSARITIVPTD